MQLWIFSKDHCDWGHTSHCFPIINDSLVYFGLYRDMSIRRLKEWARYTVSHNSNKSSNDKWLQKVRIRVNTREQLYSGIKSKGPLRTIRKSLRRKLHYWIQGGSGIDSICREGLPADFSPHAGCWLRKLSLTLPPAVLNMILEGRVYQKA